MSEEERIVDAGEASFARKHEQTLGGHLGFQVFRAMHADRKGVALVDYAGAEPKEVKAESLLVLATLLADRLKKLTSAKRVGIVLPPGTAQFMEYRSSRTWRRSLRGRCP